MGKKYKLTCWTKIVNGKVLHRIYATMNFYTQKPYDPKNKDDENIEFILIRKGTLGGWLESENNLSQTEFAWVADEACVFDTARVVGGGLVYGNALVYESATVGALSRVFGEAEIHGDTMLAGHAMAYENADIEQGYIYGNARIFGNTHLYDKGNLLVHDNPEFYNNAIIEYNRDNHLGIEICGKAKIYDNSSICYSGQDTIKINSHAHIFGNAQLHDGVHITGCAYIFGSAKIYSDTYIAENAWISSPSDVLTVRPKSNINSDILFTFFTTKKQGIKMCIHSHHHYTGDIYPIGSAVVLEALLKNNFEGSDNIASLPEFIDLAMSIAAYAQNYFSKRAKQT